MKQLLFTAALLFQFAVAPFAQVQAIAYHASKPADKSELALNAKRDFTKRFGDVDNATWSSNRDRLRARFTRSDVRYMVDYDQKGKWVSTILVYDEAQMNSDLRKIVKSNYIDHTIVNVIEVEIGKSRVHFVKLQNGASLLTLHIMNGDITETENYREG